jgi:hypothetical protein
VGRRRAAEQIVAGRRQRGVHAALSRYKGQVLSQGPIPRFVHGLIEYAAAVLFIAAPIVLTFDSGAATAISIVIGVVILVIAATTDGPTSLVNSLPLTAHVALDYVLAVLLVAMPFVAGFSDETDPTVFFIALGVAHMLITIGTRFRREETQRTAPSP